jgi:hypothetical protein
MVGRPCPKVAFITGAFGTKAPHQDCLRDSCPNKLGANSPFPLKLNSVENPLSSGKDGGRLPGGHEVAGVGVKKVFAKQTAIFLQKCVAFLSLRAWSAIGLST